MKTNSTERDEPPTVQGSRANEKISTPRFDESKVRREVNNNDDGAKSNERQEMSPEIRIELEKVQAVVDFAESLVDFSLPHVETTLPHIAYVDAMTSLADVRRRIPGSDADASDGRNCPQERPRGAKEPETQTSNLAAMPEIDDDEDQKAIIDCMVASTADESPLSANKVERYFANFGSLEWCLQAGSASAVVFRFCDPALFKTTLGFNHYIERRPILLSAVPKVGVPEDPEDREYRRSAPPTDGAEDTSLEDLSRIIDHINELAGAVDG